MQVINKIFVALRSRSQANEIVAKKTSNIKAILLITLLFASAITTLPILQSTNVGAVTTSQDKETDLDWQIQSFLYRTSISYCMKNSLLVDGFSSLNNNITNDKALAGNWFGGSGPGYDRTTRTTLGVYIIGKDGAVDCNDASLIKGALELWGLKGKEIEVLCNSGFRRVGRGGESQTINTCIGGTSDFEWRDGGKDNAFAKFNDYIQRVVYGGQMEDPILTQAQLYVYYRHSLDQSCIPGIDTTAPNTDPTIKYSADDQYGYNNVSWVDRGDATNPASVVTGSYSATGKLKKSDTISLREGYDEKVQTCAEVVKLMSDSALIPKDNTEGFLHWTIDHSTTVINNNNNSYVAQTNTTKTSCAIEGIGWIVCPVVNFLAGIADGAFGFLADNYLTTSPKIFDNTSTGTSSPTYAAWSVMRDIANVAFVIVFLIIIFSQITSFGITNYGIKKMLPRLIIAAVLVNLSYFVCQIAVDLSNILGSSLQSLLAGLIPATAAVPHFGATSGGGLGIAGGIIAAVGTGVIVWAALASLIPVLLAAVVALVMILFILIARQALIILLIVISPLAFVAFLLPNTEKLFKSWQKMLTSMLMLFPIIAVVFGASKLASTVLAGVFNDGTNENWIGQIATAAVMILPLFVVPGLLKKALDGIGGIGAKLNGLGSKVGSSLGKNVSEKSRLGQFAKYKDSETAKRRALIQSGNYAGRGGRANPRNWVSGINKGINTKMPGKFGASSAASGVSLANKMEDDEVANRTILMQSQKDYATDAIGYAESEFNAAVESGDTVRARAAQSILLNTGGPGIKRLHKSVANIRGTGKNRATINKLRTIINSSGLKGKDIGLSNWGHQKYDPASTEDPIEKAGLLAAKEDSFAKLGYDGIAMDVLEVDPKAFVGLNSTELAGQDLEFLEKGKNISGEMARAVLSNQNASQLLTKDKREFFGRRSNAEPATPTVKYSAPPTSPTTPILDQYGNPLPSSQNNRNNPLA